MKRITNINDKRGTFWTAVSVGNTEKQQQKTLSDCKNVDTHFNITFLLSDRMKINK
jgi:hypothetical protein